MEDEAESSERAGFGMPCFGSRSQRQNGGEQHEIKRLRSSLFAFINRKQQPKNYTLMIRYLLHWKVSVYSLLWTDMLLWVVLYTVVNVLYRHALTLQQQERFVRLVHSVGVWQTNVPVTFLLGFYVSTVVDRWWTAYMSIPTIGMHCLKINAAIDSNGRPERAEEIRIAITRYLNLAWILYMWKISEKVKQRFRILRELISEANRVGAKKKRGRKNSAASGAKEGTGHFESSSNFDMFHFRVDRHRRLYPALQRIQSVREDVKEEQLEKLVQDLVLLNQDPIVQENYGEIITPSEIAVYTERARTSSHTYSIEYELPLHWAVALAKRALKEGFIAAQESFDSILCACSDWSSKLGVINKYASKNLPLVYTQVVIIAVYTWFFIEVVSSQNLIESQQNNGTMGGEIPIRIKMQYWTDFYVPVFALFKLLFVLGWFKVAFILMDPFGDDMDDLPFSDILNSNLRKGRAFGGFTKSLYPRKLQPDTDQDYLHSDDELTQEMMNQQAGPWLEPVEEQEDQEEGSSSPTSETSFRSNENETAVISPPAFQPPQLVLNEEQPLLHREIP